MDFSNWITIFISIISWVVVYISTSRLNLKDKRKQMRIQYLMEVYDTLADCCQRSHLSPELEKAISKVQLLGTDEQIELTHQFISELAKSNNTSYDTLLENLRDDLRNELNLNKLNNKKILHLRISNK